MKIEDLKVGARYWIESVDQHGDPWKGIAQYVRGATDDDGYDGKRGILKFKCEDGIDGFFTIKEVTKLAQHQGSLTDQMKELLDMAVGQGLYDAADWLRSNFKF